MAHAEEVKELHVYYTTRPDNPLKKMQSLIVIADVYKRQADYLKNIFANVYLKDVIERNKIQNVDEIGILVDVLRCV